MSRFTFNRYLSRSHHSWIRGQLAVKKLGLCGFQVRPTIYIKTKWHRGPRGWKREWMTL